MPLSSKGCQTGLVVCTYVPKKKGLQLREDSWMTSLKLRSKEGGWWFCDAMYKVQVQSIDLDSFISFKHVINTLIWKNTTKISYNIILIEWNLEFNTIVPCLGKIFVCTTAYILFCRNWANQGVFLSLLTTKDLKFCWFFLL